MSGHNYDNECKLMVQRFYNPTHCYIDFDYDRYEERIDNLYYLDLGFEELIAIDELHKFKRQYIEDIRSERGKRMAESRAKNKLSKVKSLIEELS